MFTTLYWHVPSLHEGFYFEKYSCISLMELLCSHLASHPFLFYITIHIIPTHHYRKLQRHVYCTGYVAICTHSNMVVLLAYSGPDVVVNSWKGHTLKTNLLHSCFMLQIFAVGYSWDIFLLNLQSSVYLIFLFSSIKPATSQSRQPSQTCLFASGEMIRSWEQC